MWCPGQFAISLPSLYSKLTSTGEVLSGFFCIFNVDPFLTE